MSIQKITKIALFIALIAAFEPLCWGAANPERQIGLLAQLYKDSVNVAPGILASLDKPELQQLARIGRKESEGFPKLYQDAMDELIKREIEQLLQEHKGDAQKALFDVAVNNKAWTIDYLVKNGADVKAKNKYGRTALRSAAAGGHEAVVARLLAVAGVDVNAKDNFVETALRYAAEGGHEAVVARLLAVAGADVDAKGEYGRTALRYAAEGGHEAVVARLLRAGADVNAKDCNGETALMAAVYADYEAVVALLLAAEADVNAETGCGYTALMWAAKRGREAVVALLLGAGADVKAKDVYGMTVLCCAVFSGREDVAAQVAAQLIAAGAICEGLELELRAMGIEIGG